MGNTEEMEWIQNQISRHSYFWACFADLPEGDLEKNNIKVPCIILKPHV